MNFDSPHVRGWSQCRAMLSGPQLVSDPSIVDLVSDPTNNLLLMDGEIHRAVRGIVMSYFTRARLDRVEERLNNTCQELVRSLLDKRDADLISDLAEPLVLDGILSIMDVPNECRSELGDLVRKMLGMLEPNLSSTARYKTVNAALSATLLFWRDGTTGCTAGLHAVLEDAARDGIIPVKLARSTPVVMLHGGYENPLNQLGCLIAWAVENSKRFREMAVSAPTLLFEEILRLYSPVRLVVRRAAMGGKIDGKTVNRGDLVWVDIGSANLDPEQFRTPNEFDLNQSQSHLGFGHGAHKCLGTSLARREGIILIRALLSIPSEQLREFQVKWGDGIVARGPVAITRF